MQDSWLRNKFLSDTSERNESSMFLRKTKFLREVLTRRTSPTTRRFCKEFCRFYLRRLNFEKKMTSVGNDKILSDDDKVGKTLKITSAKKLFFVIN